MLLVVVAAYHVKVQVALYLAHVGEHLGEIARAEQTFLFTVPEGEVSGAFGLLSGSQEGAGDLQDGGHARGVVVCPVVDFVTVQHRVNSQVVIMRADDHDFIFLFPLDFHQHVAHGVFLVHPLADLGDGVGVHLQPSRFLPFHAVGLERLEIVFEDRLQSP